MANRWGGSGGGALSTTFLPFPPPPLFEQLFSPSAVGMERVSLARYKRCFCRRERALTQVHKSLNQKRNPLAKRKMGEGSRQRNTWKIALSANQSGEERKEEEEEARTLKIEVEQEPLSSPSSCPLSAWDPSQVKPLSQVGSANPSPPRSASRGGQSKRPLVFPSLVGGVWKRRRRWW